MNNQRCLHFSREFLCHMTPEEKKEYNAKYYQEHKDYWREYYDTKERIEKGRAETQAKIKEYEAHFEKTKAKIEAAQKEQQEMSEKYGHINKRILNLVSKVFGVKTVDEAFDKAEAAVDKAMAGNQNGNVTMNVLNSAGRIYCEIGKSVANSILSGPKKVVSSIKQSVVNTGKAIASKIKGFASAWKLGWK